MQCSVRHMDHCPRIRFAHRSPLVGRHILFAAAVAAAVRHSLQAAPATSRCEHESLLLERYERYCHMPAEARSQTRL